MNIYTASNILYKSDDFGSNWNTIGESLFNGNIQNATIAQNNSEIIAVTYGSRIKISTDGGITFMKFHHLYYQMNILLIYHLILMMTIILLLLMDLTQIIIKKYLCQIT